MSDGFYVDVEELYNVFEGLQSQSEKIIASIETAKSSYNSVITSNSMYGDVGQAIAGEINSSHNMLLMQLKDLLYSLQSDFSKEVESFQSATGEKSSTAIISHSYLKSTSEYFDTLKGEIDQIRKTINSATDSVSDLVSVTSDAKNYEYFGGNLSNAKDVVTNTIEKVSAWDSQGTALTTETSLQNLQELLGQLHQTDGLDYSDPIISQVVNNLSPIADKVKEIDDQIDESVQKAKLEAQKAKELEEKERDRIEKDWRLHHPIQATLRDWRKGLSDGLDSMTNWMKDDPNWKWLKGFGDAAFGAVGDAVFGVAEFGVDLLQYSTEGVILGYNSLTGNETPQWMKDDLQGGIETFGHVFLNTLGNVFGLVTMIPEVNNLINDLDDSTRDGSIMGAILHDVRHAKDLKQQPIRDKINLVGKFSGYESGHAAGEIVSEIVSWIGPAKLAKMAGGGKLVSRLAQMPKIQKGISYYKKARTMLANSHLGMLARESYGATKNFFTSRFGSLWDDFSRKKFAFVGLDKFRYGDDIGKHTARLYQSTGEGAEYQRISRGLYSEAAEQSGRKVSREFSEEAVENVSRDISEPRSHFVGKLRGEDVTLYDIEMKKINYVKRDRSVLKELRNDFNKSVRKDFLKSISSDIKNLKSHGLSETDIQKLKDGLVPKGYQVHHELPLDDSGTNDFSNLVLIKNDPYHKVITNYQNSIARTMKIGESKEVLWPIIGKNIYN